MAGPIICPACGRESPADAAFCAGCGAALTAPGPPSEERKVVTILFADLVGSTAQAERRDPEDVRATLSAYYARMRRELERHGGTVEKFIGDAVMAVFGAPRAHEDDPERAVRAGLAIRDGLAESEVDVRIAVHTGEALVALGARVAAGEAMVAGDVVNTAARLQTAAPVNGVLVGETTYRATAGAIEYRLVEPVRAKGKAEPVPAWEAVEAKARFGVDVEQAPLSQLVGRDEEMELLAHALARVRREREPQLVTLVGVPGIGKSRLVAELLTHVDSLPDLITWRQGRCLPYGEGVSYWALGEMVKAQAGVLETDTAPVAETKLAETVSGLVPDAEEARWVLGQVRPLLGLAGAGGADDRRSEAFAAWRRFFEGLGEQRPAVLVFEDLHWGDEGLLDFVDHLADWASGVPLLIVGTARPELLERRPGWGGGKANSTTISLRPLSDVETARLIGVLLDQSLLDADVQRELLGRAGGNPLYAEEYIRMVRDGRFSRENLPETVQGIIAARLDALALEEKQLIQDAAVLGKVFWSGALASIGGESRWTVEERLHALERKEFIRRERRSSVASEGEFAFRHVLVRDVAYAQIPRAARAVKHRLAAEWIDSLGSDRAEDRAEMLAHHYAEALDFARAAGQDTLELQDRARLALRDAGERALALSALPTARRHFEQALELWPEDDPGWPHLALRHGQAELAVAQGGEQPRTAQALERLLAAGDREHAAEAELVLSTIDWFSGRNDSTFARLVRAQALVADLPPSLSTTSTSAETARYLMLANRGDEAIELGRQTLALARELGFRELQAHALNTVGLARVNTGDTDGFADLEEAFTVASEISSAEMLRSISNEASLRASFGELDRARRLYHESIDVSARLGVRGFILWSQAELACLDYFAGAWDVALEGAEAFLANVGRSYYMGAVARTIVAEILLGRGRVDEALADRDEVLAFARSARDPQLVYPTLASYARLLALAGRSSESQEVTDELLGLAAGSTFLANQWVLDLTLTLDVLGRIDDVITILAGLTVPTGWSKASEAYARGDLPAAADVLAGLGDRSDEAFVPLRAAERGATGDHLEAALSFYRGVGASLYVRRAEALLPATA